MYADIGPWGKLVQQNNKVRACSVYCLLSFSLIGERISHQAIAQLIGNLGTYHLTSLSEKTRKSNHLLMSM
jgi:hypothetical protein